MTTTTLIHTIQHPYDWNAIIEVYGNPDMGWYEWRIINVEGTILKDTKNQGYGQAAIALRDALIYSTTP